MAQKPSIPKGTRDFGPAEMVRRNHIFDTIKAVFRIYGYLPLETPAMENLSTLLGKYGEEGDKLLFRILDSGDFFSKIDFPAKEESYIKKIIRSRNQAVHGIKQKDDTGSEEIVNLLSGIKSSNDLHLFAEELELFLNPSYLNKEISEKGLRYDLTVPFARYVVQHQSEIAFPFKRYQIQPVWRADRPQKGRYREFYQCDVDVIGSRSLLNEVELVQIVEKVFDALGIGVVLKLNNRKILSGIAETIGHADKMIDITVAIDKLEKIGMEAVKAELVEKEISTEAIAKLEPILALSGTNREKLAQLRTALSGSETGLKGIEEMETIFDYTEQLGVGLAIELDLSLARGLNYYTGAIFEVKARDFAIGSICGGGRYDDLTGIFGLPNVSGVGISFGADRIYDVMTGLGLFPADTQTATKVLFINFGGAEEVAALQSAARLRAQHIPCEVYPERAKMGKQMEYANRRGVPYVALIGSDELASGKITLKNMDSGEQHTLTAAELIEKLNG